MVTLDNTQRLKELMAKHGLSASDVAAMLNRSVQSVYEWRCVNDRNIPDHLLDLLELRLAQAGGPL